MASTKNITGFTLSFVLVNVPGMLSQTVLDRSGSSISLKLTCPECADDDVASVGTQQYACTTEPDHIFTQATARRAKEVGTGKSATLELLTPEQVADLKNETPDPALDNNLDVLAFPREQVAPYLISDGTRYFFVPDKRAERAAAIMVTAMEEMPDMVFAGLTRIKGSEKFLQLEVKDGCFILTSLVRPEQIADFPTPVDTELGPLDMKLVEKASKVLQTVVTDFDPSVFNSSQRAKHEALLDRLGVDHSRSRLSAEPVPDKTTDALLSALEASLT